jgi:hypothetical protein
LSLFLFPAFPGAFLFLNIICIIKGFTINWWNWLCLSSILYDVSYQLIYIRLSCLHGKRYLISLQIMNAWNLKTIQKPFSAIPANKKNADLGIIYQSLFEYDIWIIYYVEYHILNSDNIFIYIYIYMYIYIYLYIYENHCFLIYDSWPTYFDISVSVHFLLGKFNDSVSRQEKKSLFFSMIT